MSSAKSSKPKSAKKSGQSANLTHTETRKAVEPSQVSLSNVRGMIAELSPREVFFRLETGAFAINRIAGEVAKTVPKDLNDFDAMCVVRGFHSGRLFVGTKEKSQEPVESNQTTSLSGSYVTARRLLDLRDPIDFETAISKGYSIQVIEACLEIEKRESNRPRFISIMNNRLSKVG